MSMREQSSNTTELRRHQWKVASGELRRLGLQNLRLEATFTTLALVAGAVYASVLFVNDAPRFELAFVGLLCSATIILFIGLAVARRFFITRGRVFFAIADRSSRLRSGPFEHLRLAQRLFHLPSRVASGLAYGVTVATAPYVLPGNDSNELERAALSGFLLFANCLTGASLFSMTQFFVHGQSLFRRLVVNMWNPENTSVIILLGLAKRLSLVTVLYVSLSMTAILFSRFEIGPLVLLYGIFSVSVMFFVVIIPYVAVIRRLIDQKRSVARAIAGTMEENTRVIVSGGAGNEAVMANTRHLMELKRWTEDVSYFPLRIGSVRAFLSVAIIAILPVVVDWLLRLM